jgi:hypothetical protein
MERAEMDRMVLEKDVIMQTYSSGEISLMRDIVNQLGEE